MNLENIGWNPYFESIFNSSVQDDLQPGRVVRAIRDLYTVAVETGVVPAEVTGRFRFQAPARSAFPVVGDWVAVSPVNGRDTIQIHAVLPRKTAVTRKTAGSATEEQILAANLDTVFIVTGLDRDYNLRRIERYLTQIWNSGAQPVIVLNKSDLCDDPVARVAEVETTIMGVDVRLVSATDRSGLESLLQYTRNNATVALVGSSGVGKSTIINALLDAEIMHTSAVSGAVGKGRHTTTHRELLPLPGGGALIDSPGLRELQMWSDETSLTGSFEDIDSLAASCRFNDCTHRSEPGCAVRAALEDGSLDSGRYASYLKLQRELRHLERRQNERARLEEQAKWKKITKAIRNFKKQNW